MKTLIATLALLLATTAAVFAGGTKAKSGLARHSQTIWDNNTVVFAYNAGPGASYQWQQEEGPARAGIKGANTPTLLATDLAPGTYIFALTTTTPAGDQSTDRVVVKVKDPETATKF
jgi:hypothetical protein